MRNCTLLFATTALAATLAGCASKATVAQEDAAPLPSQPEPAPVPTQQPKAEEQPVTEAKTMRESPIAAGTDFDTKLFAEVGRSSGNFSVSAPNVRVVLAALSLGARGETRSEMVKLLDLPAANAAQVTAAKKESAAWEASAGKAKLTAAARIWSDKEAPPLAAFLKNVKAGFGAEPKALDFRNNPEPARAEINEWAKTHTEGLIPELLSGGSITPLTRMVATSALYFKADWAQKFQGSSTRDAQFHLASGRAVQVPMMSQSETFATQSTASFVAATLPYDGSKLAMTVVRAADGNSTDALETQYITSGVAAFTKGMQNEHIDLRLPKFKMAVGGSIATSLKAMGMPTAFSDAADFEDALKAKGVSLSDVIHKVVVKVDEEGTEAAAATAGIMAVRGMIQRPKLVAFDRAFLFFIHDASGKVLFSGRVADPRAE